jgi:hypothetical protein
MFLGNRKTRSLKYRLAIGVINTVVATTCGGVGLVIQGEQPTDVQMAPAHDDNVGVVSDKPLAKGGPRWLLEKHRAECWTKDEQAKAALPSRVIARTDSGDWEYGTRLVQRAWAELPVAYGGDAGDHGVVALAFCK